MAEIILKTVDVCRDFKTASETVHAVKNVNIEVEKGQLVILRGRSGSGKTTLVEAMLYESGVIKRRGTVEAKNTVSDYFPVEMEYGYAVFPTV